LKQGVIILPVKPSVYIETTIPSYLTAWPSRDIIRAGQQQITRDWWQKRKGHFTLFISVLVLKEVQAGDPVASQDRWDAIRDIQILEVTEEVDRVAKEILNKKIVPMTEEADAYHIATAAVHKMKYLMTWNCRHIANAEIFGKLQKYFLTNKLDCPVICTPSELMGKQ
jgi:predicted nucleic acid-binding protein